jgi:hypothetical protein
MFGISFSTIALFTGAVSLGVVSNLVLYAMVGEVNRKVPEDEQIKYMFWFPGKLAKVKKKYRNSYPRGRLVLLFNTCFALSCLLWLAFVWQFGYFR